jgi:hypothetical protein
MNLHYKVFFIFGVLAFVIFLRMSNLLYHLEPTVSNKWNTTKRREDDGIVPMTAASTIHQTVCSLPPIVIPISRKGPYFTDITSTSSSKLATVTVVRTNYPWKVVVPPTPSISELSSWNTSTGWKTQRYRRQRLPMETTLRQAKHHHCDIIAANGGPFDSQGWTTGPTIVGGKLMRTTPNSLLDSTLVGLGTTAKTKQWILGNYRQIISTYNNTNTNSSLVDDIDSFCTGFGWLVYDGRMVADNTINPTGAKVAPRTAIGLDYDRNVLLMVVDGCEYW